MLGLGNTIAGGAALSEFLPTEVSDLSIWLKNGEGVAAAQWDDSSGNNNHITQGTGGNQASVVDGGLDFEGDNDDHYDLTTGIDLGDNNPFSLFVVLKMESYASQNTILSVASGNDKFIEMQNVDQIRYRQTGSTAVLKFNTSGLWALNEKMLVTITKNTSRALTVYKGGGEEAQSGASTSTAGSGAFTANQFGGRSSGPDRDFDGIIYEFLLYEKLVSTAELTDIHTYLKNKHGV